MVGSNTFLLIQILVIGKKIAGNNHEVYK